MNASGQAAAWAWVEHLRDGGTTAWSRWRAQSPQVGFDAARGRHLPGAQQLELLRRLNQRGAPSSRLVERVLTASAPGRGTPDLELDGAAPDSRFGPRPVDPEQLPTAELVRVASGLIAADLVATVPAKAATSGERDPVRRIRALLTRRRYRLVGDPWLAEPIRAALTRHGRPPGGRGARVYVLGTDVQTMVADAWTARCLAEGGPSWPDWLRGLRRRDETPPRIDLAAAVDQWTRHSPGRVEVVLDPDLLPGLLRYPSRWQPTVPSLSANAVELARRVSVPLGLLVLPRERARLLRGPFAEWLSRSAPGAPLAVPASSEDWLRAVGARLRGSLLEAGYPVHGDPAVLEVRGLRAGASPEDDGVFEVAARWLLEQPARPGSATDEERHGR